MKTRIYVYSLLAVVLFSAWGLFTPVRAEAANAIIYKYEYKEGKLDIEYPHIDGMQNQEAQETINGVIQDVVDNFISKNNESEFTTVAKLKYAVHLNEGHLLSISINRYIYSGGAHGMSSLEGYTFDLNSGKRYKFSELFKFDRENKQIINKIIAQQIRDRNIYVFSPFNGVRDNPNFYLESGKKVVFVFQPYEIAPYSEGILKFSVSY